MTERPRVSVAGSSPRVGRSNRRTQAGRRLNGAGPGQRVGWLYRRVRRRGTAERGYAVVGIDNFSKYGKVAKSYDDNPNYRLVEGDATDAGLMTELLADCDHFIAGAAMIGGISYFHTHAYDLLATNERIIAASCDAAIAAHRAAGCARSPTCPRRWSSRAPTSGRLTRVSSGRYRRPCRPTDSRSWPSSTSPGRPGISTGFPTRWCGRSTVSA